MARPAGCGPWLCLVWLSLAVLLAVLSLGPAGVEGARCDWYSRNVTVHTANANNTVYTVSSRTALSFRGEATNCTLDGKLTPRREWVLSEGTIVCTLKEVCRLQLIQGQHVSHLRRTATWRACGPLASVLPHAPTALHNCVFSLPLPRTSAVCI